MTTDVAPTSDAELEQVRVLTNADLEIQPRATAALLVRLDAAEAKVSKFSTRLDKVHDNLNELRITNSEEILALEVERDRLAALNAELVEGLQRLAGWSRPFIEKSPISAETLWREFPAAVENAKILLAKARPQEPAT